MGLRATDIFDTHSEVHDVASYPLNVNRRIPRSRTVKGDIHRYGTSRPTPPKQLHPHGVQVDGGFLRSLSTHRLLATP